MSVNSRNVIPNSTGGWDVKNENGNLSAHAETQAAAIERATEILSNLGGGELTIHGKDGKIREKNTVPNGNDPRSVKG